MKFIPVEIEPVDACQWKYNDVSAVLEFTDMLREHGLWFSFEGEDMESWDVEVHVFRGDLETPAAIVHHRKWLVIQANGTLETVTDAAFTKNYRRQSCSTS